MADVYHGRQKKWGPWRQTIGRVNGMLTNLLAWAEGDRGFGHHAHLYWWAGSVYHNHRFPARLDTAPHLAFVAGVMPAYAYADWLEENVPEVPGNVLALLREPVEVST